ncbi:MAG TPA: hypothetical protein VGQ90_06565 [Stellaceae bacterium]|jgi:hypothetical protein|nr:hypothetical protein [Stellaceae bacterium]
MEDDGFVDDEFIEETAREYLDRYGFDGLAVLRERVGIAAASGDELLTQRWREILEAAERMMGLDR